MNEEEKWENKVRDFFDLLKSNKKSFMVIDNIKLYVFPNVFSPKIFFESRWFAKTLPKIVGKSSFLEIGTGTGIIALFVELNGAKVVATDINPDAVKNAKFNFKKHNLKIKTLLGDVYEPLDKNEKFDFIFWNHPFNFGKKLNEKMLLKAVFDYNYNSLEKYISEAHLHLKPNGKLLIGTSSIASLDIIEKLAKKYGYNIKILEIIKIPSEIDSSKYNDFRICEFLII